MTTERITLSFDLEEVRYLYWSVGSNGYKDEAEKALRNSLRAHLAMAFEDLHNRKPKLPSSGSGSFFVRLNNQPSPTLGTVQAILPGGDISPPATIVDRIELDRYV